MNKLLSPLLLMIATAHTVNGAEVDLLEGKTGYERRASISEFADSIWENQTFSFDQGLNMLQGLSNSDRYYAIKSMFGNNRSHHKLISEPLSTEQINTLLSGVGPQREEIIQYLADYGVPSPNMNADQIQTLMGAAGSRRYDQPLRALLGSNRLAQNYGLSAFGVKEANQLLNQSHDRSGMIRYMADRTLFTTALTVKEAEQIIGQQGPMGRHDAVKALLGMNQQQQDYLALPLSHADALQLVRGSALPEEIIRHFTNRGLFAAPLTATESQQLLQDIQHTDRFNVVKSLLGENRQQQGYLQLPLGLSEARTLLDGMAYQDEMIGLFTDHQALQSPLNPDEALQLLGSLTRADRYDALSALLGNNELQQSYLQNSIDATAASTLLEGSSYQDELIQQMADIGSLQKMDGDHLIDLIQELFGENRYKAISALSGKNRLQHHYLSQPLSVKQLERLLERSANPFLIIEQLGQQQLIEGPLSAEAIEPILSQLYGDERAAATVLLTR